MIGPALDVRGGISTVERNLLACAGRGHWRFEHIASACDGPKSKKALRAVVATAALVRRLIRRRPDLVHIHFSTGASFLRKIVYCIVTRFFRIPVVLHCHSGTFAVFIDRLHRRIRLTVRSLLNTADAIVVLSSEWEKVVRDLGVSVPVHIVPNPVALPPDINAGDEPTVLFLGRLGRTKGTYDLLEAVPSVLAACPEAQFVLCGDGEGPKCRSLVDSQPWANHVTIKSWIDPDERHDLLKRCALLVLPSYHEGLPVAVLEAMSYSIPVVSTTVGGIPEAVQDGVTGFLIEPGDVNALAARISALLIRKDLRAQMGRRARSRVEAAFESSVVIRRLEDVYDSVLRRHVRADPTTNRS